MSYYLPSSKEIINQIKEIPITKVAKDLGYTITKREGDRCSLEEHDSVVIYEKTNSFYRFSTGKGGSPIDFVSEFHTNDVKDSINYLRKAYLNESFDYTYEKPVPPSTAPEEHDKKEIFVLPEKVNGKYSKTFAYLTKTRGINSEIISKCVKDGLIYEEASHGNIVFVGLNKEGTAEFATLRGTLTSKPFRGDVRNSNQKIGWYVDNNQKTMYICESPIDALSVMTLRKNAGVNYQDANYLSMCGAAKVDTVLTRIKENPHIEKIILANDNDAAGEKANKKIEELLIKNYPNIKISSIKPKTKDFNEDITAEKNKEKSKEMEI